MKYPQYFVKLFQRTAWGIFFGVAAWYLLTWSSIMGFPIWPFSVGGGVVGLASAAIEWYLKERYG